MDVQTELQSFINTYTNQANVGDTPENKSQCVGLIECWLDVTGYPHIWGNAIDLLISADRNFYEVVLNTPTNFPAPGDIAVFGIPYGEYIENNTTKYAGHTGVVVTADANTVVLFEQNDPTGSTPHQQEYPYTYVKGWIHFKDLQQAQITKVDPGVNTYGLDLTNSQSLQVVLDTWNAVANNQYKPIADYNKLQIQVDTLTEQLSKSQQVDESSGIELNNYHAMQALGYNTVDDITKAFQAKDTTNLALQTEITQVRSRNGILAGEIEKIETESNETAKLGQKFIDDNASFTDGFRKLIEIIDIKDKPSWSKIFDQVLFYKDMYNKFMEHLDAEQQSKVTQTIKKVVSSDAIKKINGSDLILQLFNMIPKKKGGE